MAYKVFFTARAQADIAAAFAYLEERAPIAARRWYNSIMTEIVSLGEMPNRCPLTCEAGLEFRQLVRGRYRIMFDVVEDTKTVRILTVRHGARRRLTNEEIQRMLNDFD